MTAYMLSMLYAISHPSVHPSVYRVDQSKKLKLGSYNFHQPHPSSFCGISLAQKFQRVPLRGGIKQGCVGKTNHFLPLCLNISRTVRDTSKVITND